MRPKILRNFVDLGLFRKLLALRIFFNRAIQMRCYPLQQREGQCRLALRQKVNLQFKVIASLERLIRDILPDEDARGQKDGFEREHD